MAAFGAQIADDSNLPLEYSTYLDQNQYKYHEINSSELQSTGIFHEMAVMPPPQVTYQEETAQLADNRQEPIASTSKTSRHKILTSVDVDNVQNESIKPRTRKQTEWGVNVFKGNIFLLKNSF